MARIPPSQERDASEMPGMPRSLSRPVIVTSGDTDTTPSTAARAFRHSINSNASSLQFESTDDLASQLLRAALEGAADMQDTEPEKLQHTVSDLKAGLAEAMQMFKDKNRASIESLLPTISPVYGIALDLLDVLDDLESSDVLADVVNSAAADLAATGARSSLLLPESAQVSINKGWTSNQRTSLKLVLGHLVESFDVPNDYPVAHESVPPMERASSRSSYRIKLNEGWKLGDVRMSIMEQGPEVQGKIEVDEQTVFRGWLTSVLTGLCCGVREGKAAPEIADDS